MVKRKGLVILLSILMLLTSSFTFVKAQDINSNENNNIIAIDDHKSEEIQSMQRSVELEDKSSQKEKEIEKNLFKQIDTVETEGNDMIEDIEASSINLEDKSESINDAKIDQDNQQNDKIALDEQLINVNPNEVFKFEERSENELVITGVSNSFENYHDLRIPAYINGKLVKEIGKYAFKGKGLSGKLILPESIEIIRHDGFASNNISEVVAEGLKKVETGAFYQNDLKELNLPNIEIIGIDAFKNVPLEIIDLPKAKIIKEGAFYQNDLKELNLPNVEIIKEGAFYKDVKAPVELVLNIPNVEQIGKGAFENNSIKNLNLPQLEHIGVNAFKNVQPEKIDLPRVVVIEEGAFYSDVKVANELTLNLPSVKKIGKGAFENNSLTRIDLPKVEVLSELAFRNATKVDAKLEIDLYAVESIEEEAFAYNNIERISLNSFDSEVRPDETYVASNAFKSSSVAKVYLDKKSRLNNEKKLFNEYFIKMNEFDLQSLEEGADYFTQIFIPGESYQISYFPEYVINPGENFYDKFLFLDETEDFPEVKMNAAYDKEDNEFYCIDASVPIVKGIFEYEIVQEAIFIEKFGVMDSNINVVGASVSIDQAPNDFEYGYTADLINKLIYHANDMIEEGHFTPVFSSSEIDEHTGKNKLLSASRSQIVHLVASNMDIPTFAPNEKFVLNRENFRDIVSKTDVYEEIIKMDGVTSGEESILELFNRIENDNRQFTNAKYLRHLITKRSIEKASQGLNFPGEEHHAQDVIEPGKPVNETVDIQGRKIWKNAPDIKPTIEIQLYQNDKAFGKPITLKNGETEYKWKDLPKFDKFGNEYHYRVDELEVPEGYVKTIDGFNIINDHTGLRDKYVDLYGEKTWINAPENKPTIQVQLYRNGVAYREPITLANGETKYSWKNLPIHDEHGKNYIYTVDELNLPTGYKKTIDGLNIINEYTGDNEETLNITGRKIWKNAPDIKPTIEIQLYQNGQAYKDAIVLKDGQTEYKWTDLPKTNDLGEYYIYTIDEINVPKGYHKTVQGFNIINTYINSDANPTDNPTEQQVVPQTSATNSYIINFTFLLLSILILLIKLKKRILTKKSNI